MHRKIPALLMLLVILVSFLSAPALAFTPENYDSTNPAALTADMLYSKAAILIDADSGNMLFGKNENELMNPASTTKIMTLLLALESGIPLDMEIAIPQAAGSVPSGSSLIPVYPGETMTFGDLLKGFQVHSGNDGGLAIAVLVSGSVDNFVAKMNQRAQELGLTNTRYANPHGYTADGHYSTARDLAMLTKYAMQNETFRELVKTVSGSIYVKERGEIKLYSKTLILKPDSKYYYPGCIGVKTGSTSAAGECFVGAAEKDGATIISVVLGATEDDYRWIDTTRLFDFGWTCYDSYTLDQMFEVARSRIASIRISNAAEDDPYAGMLDLNIAQISDTSYLRMVEHNSVDALYAAVDDFERNASVQITRDLTAPISMGEIVGDFSFVDSATNNMISAKLVASRDVAEKVEQASIIDIFPVLRIFSNRIFLLLLVVLALLLILIIVLAASRRAAKQRRRRQIYERRRQEYLRRQAMLERQNAAQGRHRARSYEDDPYDRPAPRRASRSGDYDRRRPR